MLPDVIVEKSGLQHILATFFNLHAGVIRGLSSLALLLAVILGYCMPLHGNQQPSVARMVVEYQPGGKQTSATLSRSARRLSERAGPPGAHRKAGDLQILPLSHHSLWDRLRDGFEFTQLEHAKIDLQIEFLQNGMRSLHNNLGNARPYLRHIIDEIEHAEMPLDIALLPLIESAFNPHAKSSQNALGLWQFIPSTGKLYGLEETDWYSGRKDVIASTTAALTYLQQLHEKFDGDWLLALAAYNTGQGNVRAAIKNAKKQGLVPNFWNLRLAKETRDYVPRLIAVTKMISEPETYGVILPPLTDRKTARMIDLDRTVSLQQAASLTGISMDALVNLNPGYKKQVTPPNGPNRLLIPIEGAEVLIRWNNSQRATSASASNTTDVRIKAPTRDFKAFKQVEYRRHTVQKGDNLWNIARQFDTDLEALTNWNFIGRENPLQPGDKLWYAKLTDDAEQIPRQKLIKYRVVANDSISLVGKKFNTRFAELKKWNQSLWHTHSLYPGQILYIPVP